MIRLSTRQLVQILGTTSIALQLGAQTPKNEDLRPIFNNWLVHSYEQGYDTKKQVDLLTKELENDERLQQYKKKINVFFDLQEKPKTLAQQVEEEVQSWEDWLIYFMPNFMKLGVVHASHTFKFTDYYFFKIARLEPVDGTSQGFVTFIGVLGGWHFLPFNSMWPYMMED